MHDAIDHLDVLTALTSKIKNAKAELKAPQHLELTKYQ